jgi:hypothetical protein
VEHVAAGLIFGDEGVAVIDQPPSPADDRIAAILADPERPAQPVMLVGEEGVVGMDDPDAVAVQSLGKTRITTMVDKLAKALPALSSTVPRIFRN